MPRGIAKTSVRRWSREPWPSWRGCVCVCVCVCASNPVGNGALLLRLRVGAVEPLHVLIFLRAKNFDRGAANRYILKFSCFEIRKFKIMFASSIHDF